MSKFRIHYHHWKQERITTSDKKRKEEKPNKEAIAMASNLLAASRSEKEQVRNIVTTSKALVTTSDALVPSSEHCS